MRRCSARNPSDSSFSFDGYGGEVARDIRITRCFTPATFFSIFSSIFTSSGSQVARDIGGPGASGGSPGAGAAVRVVLTEVGAFTAVVVVAPPDALTAEVAPLAAVEDTAAARRARCRCCRTRSSPRASSRSCRRRARACRLRWPRRHAAHPHSRWSRRRGRNDPRHQMQRFLVDIAPVSHERCRLFSRRPDPPRRRHRAAVRWIRWIHSPPRGGSGAHRRLCARALARAAEPQLRGRARPRTSGRAAARRRPQLIAAQATALALAPSHKPPSRSSSPPGAIALRAEPPSRSSWCRARTGAPSRSSVALALARAAACGIALTLRRPAARRRSGRRAALAPSHKLPSRSSAPPGAIAPRAEPQLGAASWCRARTGPPSHSAAPPTPPRSRPVRCQV